MSSTVSHRDHRRDEAASYTTSEDEELDRNPDHQEDGETSSDDDSGEEGRTRDCLTCPPFSRRRQLPMRWLSPSLKDPKAKWIQEWNRIFLFISAAGLFIDPLFFYALSINDRCMCLFVDGWFGLTVTALRCMTDALHVWNMWLQVRVGNRKVKVDGSDGEVGEEMGGGGERRRFRVTKKGLLFDIFVVLPLPQV